MNIDITTPALLFPAISLLLLAYTNRFLVIAQLIRELHSKYKQEKDEIIIKQIQSLRKRVDLIKKMQAIGIASLFLCVLCMFLLFAGEIEIGKYMFGLSLLLLLISLGYSFREIQISVYALNLRLSDLENLEQSKSN